MTPKPFLQRLDDSVRWTGIPALAEQPPRRRPMRWPATVALLLAFGGYAASLAMGMQGGDAAIGYVVEIVGFAIGSLVQIVGPLKPIGGMEKADEWDRAIRARAYLFTFAVFAAVTFATLWLLFAAVVMTFPTAALIQGTMQTFFLLMSVLVALPTAYASWTFHWLADD